MKKSFVLLLVLVISGVYGCAQKTNQDLVATSNATVSVGITNGGAFVPTTETAEISASTISSDIESITQEVASIDINETGDAITPINDDDLTID